RHPRPRLRHLSGVPSGYYGARLTRSASVEPAPVSAVPSTLVESRNRPVSVMFPLLSTAMLRANSSFAAPKLSDQRWAPDAVYFATNTSLLPLLTRMLPPHLVDPEKSPVTSTQFVPPARS